jgi:hypothetical protein
VFVNELKGFIGFILTVGIGTTPATLFKNQDEFITVLKNRVIDCSGLNASRVHFETATGTEGRTGMSFEDKSLFRSVNDCVGDEDFGIF